MIDCIFHVSTFIPSDTEGGDQQHERLRHINNDIVVLIFKEYNVTPEPIDIFSFKSTMNQVFLIVGYDVSTIHQLNAMYTLNMAVKQEIKPVPPFITLDRYVHDSSLHDMLIAKSPPNVPSHTQ